jgi:hypothetical protein
MIKRGPFGEFRCPWTREFSKGVEKQSISSYTQTIMMNKY